MLDSRAQNVNSPIHSEFADDPDFQDLLEFFFESLAEQRGELAAAFEQKQWEELTRKAHQLKGAGGGYGFPGLTQTALALETACQTENHLEIPSSLENLLAYMDRILSA